jgi:hypothetical protein
VPEFDPAYDITDRDICQLVPGTKDGFPEMDEPFLYYSKPHNHNHENTHSKVTEMANFLLTGLYN